MVFYSRRQILQSTVVLIMSSLAGCTNVLSGNEIQSYSTSSDCHRPAQENPDEKYILSNKLDVETNYLFNPQIEFQEKNYDSEVYDHEEAQRYAEHYLVLSNQKSANDLITRNEIGQEFLENTDFDEYTILIIINNMNASNYLKLSSIRKYNERLHINVYVDSTEDPTDASSQHALFIRLKKNEIKPSLENACVDIYGY